VCVDDLGSPAEAPALALLPAPGAASGVVLVAGGHGSQFATWFQGPVASLRRARSGLLLTPVPGDAEVLGLRLPRTPVPRRPGSGWLVLDGGPVRVQVARHRPRTEAVLR
jgi:S-DNA-T family DNA segregation ATPase FtsK/SpoIIIE